MRKLSLFWKIYLSVLAVLFLPPAVIYCYDLWAENKMVHQVEAEFETRQAELLAFTQEMAREFERLIGVSTSEDKRATILSWVKKQRLDNGLDIYVTLDDSELPEQFSLRVQDSGARIAPPLAAMAQSPSGRVTVYSAQEPYEDWDELRTPLPARLFLLMAAIGTLISYFVVRYLVTPLRQMEEATTRIAGGDFSARVGDVAVAGQDELRKLGSAFNVMAEQVQSLLDCQKHLLSAISHELRSPLQRLNFALALIEEKGHGDVDQESLEQARLDVRRIDAMVEELLALTRSESALGMDNGRVALRELVLCLLEAERFDWNAENKGVEFHGEDVCVWGDAKLLDRAIRNLIHNAVRYSPAKGRVEVSLACEGSEAVLRVRDHGQGVPEEELEKIFLPFYRTGFARERVSGGTGLGLPIVRRVAEKHGGSCVATNTPGGGLLMTLRLPIYECSGDTQEEFSGKADPLPEV